MKYSDYIDSVLSEEVLTELTSDESYAKNYEGKLDRAIFDTAVAADPTSKGTEKVGKYVPWLIKTKAYVYDDVTELLQKYDKYKDKIPADKRDINKLKYGDLDNLITKLEEEGVLISKTDIKKEADNVKKKAEAESELVFQDENYIVVSPKTEFASCYFGKGTEWCTASTGSTANNMFDRYNRTGTLYIVKERSGNKKWQLFVGDSRESENRDASDYVFDPFDEFSGDKKMIAWMEEVGVTNPSGLTEHQLDDLASMLVSSFSNWGEYRDRAMEEAKEMFRSMVENLEDVNAYDYCSNQIDSMAYNISDALDTLEEKHGIDRDNPENKLKLIPYADYGDMNYDIEHENDPFDKEFIEQFTTKYSESVDDMVKRLFNKKDPEKSFDTLLKYLPKWAENVYTLDHDRFIEAKETLIDKWNEAYQNSGNINFKGQDIKTRDHITPMLDEKQEQAIKDIFDKVEAQEYNKQGHPTLALDSKETEVDKINELIEG